MNVEAVITALLSTALLSAIPLALAAVGEAVGERAGLINLGAEGTMLLGAFAGFWVSYHTDSLALGLVGGAIAGLAAGILFGVIAVIVEADLVLLGLGFTLAGGGLTAFLFREEFGSNQPLLAGSMSRPFGEIADVVPVIGPALLDQKWFFYVAWVVVAVVEILLRKTTLGLRIRAVGEAPAAVDAFGISVVAIRVTAAIVAGTLTGLAGASLTIVELGFFLPNVTLGTGFIAIALAMLGRLSPWRIAITAVVFGSLRGLGYGLQLVDVSVQSGFARLLPYVGVVVALVIIGRGVRMPAKLGETYPRRRKAHRALKERGNESSLESVSR
jgi:simple sugar transport system permease protein